MILEKTVLVEIKYIRFQTETVVYVNEKFSEQLKTNMTIILSNQEIQKEDKTKFLGIIIDQHLTWKSHIDYIVPKISKMIGTLRTIRFFVNQPLLKVLYNSFICPYLHYGNIGWGTTILQDQKNVKTTKEGIEIDNIFVMYSFPSASFPKVKFIRQLSN